MVSSHNQSVTDAGSKNRPSMLARGSYVPWSSRFMRYIDGKKDYGKMLKDSILNGPYQMKKLTDQGNLTDNPPIPPFERDQEEEDLTGDDKKQSKADIDAMNAILFEVDGDSENDIQDNNVHDQKNGKFELLIRNVQLEAEKTNKVIKVVNEENALL
ncbi:hypothetical protein Tco_1119202 [Tanacetum coccineum]